MTVVSSESLAECNRVEADLLLNMTTEKRNAFIKPNLDLKVLPGEPFSQPSPNMYL